MFVVSPKCRRSFAQTSSVAHMSVGIRSTGRRSMAARILSLEFIFQEWLKGDREFACPGSGFLFEMFSQQAHHGLCRGLVERIRIKAGAEKIFIEYFFRDIVGADIGHLP